MFGTRLVNSLTTANVIAPLQRSPPARAVLDPRKPGDGDEKLPKKTKSSWILERLVNRSILFA